MRNPPAAVHSISWTSSASASGEFAYATEAENFYTVPEEVRTLAETITLNIQFDFGFVRSIEIIGTDLTLENAQYDL